MINVGRIVYLIILLSPVFSFSATAEDFTNAIRAFLQQRVQVEKQDVAVVIGIVDANGSRVVGWGKLDNGTGQEVNGNTVFEIGSVTKTFTGLLLQDMVERGEMRLDDPVAKYLPRSVKMPTYHGRQITLLDLATHTSGLPLLPYNLDPKLANNPYADYTPQKLYDFLSSYKLTRAPGTVYDYSELGMELLGQAIALRAGTNYESLVMDRICRPLKMDSTRVTLTPAMKCRQAVGHDKLGHKQPILGFQSLVGGSGLRSTANDLLKYLAANLDLTPSRLTSLMDQTHKDYFVSREQDVCVGLGWAIACLPQGRGILMHGGATPGCLSFIGLDPKRHRGVVILTSSNDGVDVGALGMVLLESRWQTSHRPIAAKIKGMDYDSYSGEYKLVPSMPLGILLLRTRIANLPNSTIAIMAGLCLAGLLLVVLLYRLGIFQSFGKQLICRWCSLAFRGQCVVGGGVILIGIVLSVLTVSKAEHIVWGWSPHPIVGIYHQGNRLFVECTGSLHDITGELLPESKTRFFERLTGIPVTFFHDAHGNATRLAASLFGTELSFVKISGNSVPPPKPPVAIRLDPKLWASYLGEYEFPPDSFFRNGFKLTIQQEGNQMIGRASDLKAHWGTFHIYPESKTNFFFMLNTVNVQLEFVRNTNGEVTSVVRHVAWLPDSVGKKLQHPD